MTAILRFLSSVETVRCERVSRPWGGRARWWMADSIRHHFPYAWGTQIWDRKGSLHEQLVKDLG